MTIVTHWASWTGGAAKGYAFPGGTYPAEPTVTAQDATNAAKLAGLGYVAKPTTPWIRGESITVGTFKFYWDGAAWQPGVAIRINAAPGSVWPAEPTVTAQDATNAAKLSPLGYVAVPATAWTTGQFTTIGVYQFNWTSTAWAAGVHAFMADAPVPAAQGFDPGAHTVNEVEAYADAHPDEVQAILAAEEDGKNRITLVNYLNGLLGQ